MTVRGKGQQLSFKNEHQKKSETCLLRGVVVNLLQLEVKELLLKSLLAVEFLECGSSASWTIALSAQLLGLLAHTRGVSFGLVLAKLKRWVFKNTAPI